MRNFEIRKQMGVFASCGARVGVVDRVDDTTIMLTKNDPQAGGKHHYIPLDWVVRVDQNVYLKVSAADVMRGWRAETTSNAADINNTERSLS